jgi:hypothetical protein
MDPKDNENSPENTDNPQVFQPANNTVINTNQSPEKQKNNTKLIIIIVIIIVSMIILLVSSLFAIRFFISSVNDNKKSENVVDKVSENEQAYNFIGLSLTKKSGWELSVIDQGGVNQIRLTGTTCMVTTAQNKGDLSSLADKDPEYIADRTADVYAKSISENTKKEIKFSKISNKYFQTSDLTGGTKSVPSSVKFYGRNTQYVGTDGKTYNVDIYIRHLFNPDVELVVMTACEKNEFNTNIDNINAALDDIKVFYE